MSFLEHCTFVSASLSVGGQIAVLRRCKLFTDFKMRSSLALRGEVRRKAHPVKGECLVDSMVKDGIETEFCKIK